MTETSPSDFPSKITHDIGWDIEKTEQKETVTFIRQKVVYGEFTMSKREFDSMMVFRKLDPDDFNEYFDDVVEEKFKTDEFLEDCGEFDTRYAIFEGDIQSMSDDVIQWGDFKWKSYSDDMWDIQKVKFNVKC